MSVGIGSAPATIWVGRLKNATAAGSTRTVEGQTQGRVRLRLGAGERSGATGSSDSECLPLKWIYSCPEMPLKWIYSYPEMPLKWIYLATGSSDSDSSACRATSPIPAQGKYKTFRVLLLWRYVIHGWVSIVNKDGDQLLQAENTEAEQLLEGFLSKGPVPGDKCRCVRAAQVRVGSELS
eukprot:COSAG06_NODE_24255_length_668_cov_0.984183_1_plen_179_part_10